MKKTIGLFILLTICSFLLYYWHFFANYKDIIVSCFGVFLTISLTLLLVDPVKRHIQKTQWSKARLVTKKSLMRHLCDLTSELILYLDLHDHSWLGNILDGRDQWKKESLLGFEQLLSVLQKAERGDMFKENSRRSPSDCVVDLYNNSNIKWDFNRIEFIIIPRLLYFASVVEQKIINQTILLSTEWGEFQNSVISHKMVCTQEAMSSLIKLIEVAKETYKKIELL